MALRGVTKPTVLEFLPLLEKVQSRCSQSKHGLYGHVTPNFTARKSQRNGTKEEVGVVFSWRFATQRNFSWAGLPSASPISVVTLK